MADATRGLSGFGDGAAVVEGASAGELEDYYEKEMVGTSGPRKLMALEAVAACVWPVVEVSNPPLILT